MKAPLFSLVLMGGLGSVILSGCQPLIGDDCRVDTDCSQLGDRVCDTSQPGGYCSQFNCKPESCPEGEAICVAFSSELSSVRGCQDPNRPSPFERTFCMRGCERDADCRPGYACIDVGGEDPWSAEVIQKDPTTTKICAAPLSAELPDPDLLEELPENVCSGADAFASGAAGASAD